MDKLYSWTVSRAGATLTVSHSTGKITGVVTVGVFEGRVVAHHGDGRRFELAVK